MDIKKIHELFLSSSSVCTDTRKITENCMFFALKGENFDGNKFASDALKSGAKHAIIDDKTFKNGEQYILVDDVLKTLQDLAAYHRNYLNLKIIALTGSNGKTTTKELINAVLNKDYNTVATVGNLNNHIGVPLTLLSMDKTTEIGIVEMGANHQKEIEFLCSIAMPDFGYITNFGKAHLEGFGGIEGVIKGKSELYTHLRNNDKHILVNTEDIKQVELTHDYSKIIPFGAHESHIQIEFLEANPCVNVQFGDLAISSQLIGSYNFSNISAAIAFGTYFNISKIATKNAIENYIPQNNRSQIIHKNSNKIILDAYNANPTSMQAALDNLNSLNDSNKIAILGDMFELGDAATKEHAFIANYASLLNFEHLYLVGENFAKTSSHQTCFKSFDDLKQHIINSDKIKDRTILIKGSRGMALERLIEFL
jgi:UDP-N-acetylmuramoyl-tripeptide--D-alanyl-D-alanine ligase